jgi:hypothetical protein
MASIQSRLESRFESNQKKLEALFAKAELHGCRHVSPHTNSRTRTKVNEHFAGPDSGVLNKELWSLRTEENRLRTEEQKLRPSHHFDTDFGTALVLAWGSPSEQARMRRENMKTVKSATKAVKGLEKKTPTVTDEQAASRKLNSLGFLSTKVIDILLADYDHGLIARTELTGINSVTRLRARLNEAKAIEAQSKEPTVSKVLPAKHFKLGLELLWTTSLLTCVQRMPESERKGFYSLVLQVSNKFDKMEKNLFELHLADMKSTLFILQSNYRPTLANVLLSSDSTTVRTMEVFDRLFAETDRLPALYGFESGLLLYYYNSIWSDIRSKMQYCPVEGDDTDICRPQDMLLLFFRAAFRTHYMEDFLVMRAYLAKERAATLGFKNIPEIKTFDDFITNFQTVSLTLLSAFTRERVSGVLNFCIVVQVAWMHAYPITTGCFLAFYRHHLEVRLEKGQDWHSLIPLNETVRKILDLEPVPHLTN